MNGQGYFVTGTGTDVGKTYVAARIMRHFVRQGIRAGYFKAALSGAVREGELLIPGDAREVLAFAGSSQDPSSSVPYILEHAVSPHLAARLEGKEICLETILESYHNISEQYDIVIAEGSGGLICPLKWETGEKLMLTDVMKALNFPLILVGDAGLGTINAVMLSVSYAGLLDLPIAAIVLNRYDEHNFMHIDNRKTLSDMTGLPVHVIPQ